MSVVTKRERRKNAGQRMGSLLGKAMEEDDTFWSHETWNDDDDGEDSGNDSFHESDEDSVLKKDVFDSDFDDSESDNEDDDVAAGEAEELELQKSERARRNQKSSTNYVDAKSSTARGNRGKRGAANKRAVGVGFNAGIVLKFPSNSSNSLALLPTPSSISALQLTKPSTTSIQSAITAAAAAADTKTKIAVNNLPEPSTLPAPVTSSRANAVSSSSRKSKNRIVGDPIVRSSRVSLRERRSTHGVRTLRENRSTPSRQSATITTNAAAAASTGRSKSSNGGSNSRTTTTTAKRKRHSQEELLLEAIHETEPENQRWLFGRKRTQDQHDKDKDLNSGFRDKYRGRKVIQKFHSRRGCLNTLTFPEMDAVPEILTRRQPQQQQQVQEKNLESRPSNIASSSSAEPSQQQVSSNICVITGKPGRYKDPITNLPYHNLAAFKELRRRHDNGIPILKNNKGGIDGEETKNNKQVTKKKSMVRGTSQGDSVSFSGTATNGDQKPATRHHSNGEKKISANDGKNNKTNAEKKAPPKKSSSPGDAKLPFQSPKPPSRPSISTVHKQQPQQPYPKLPVQKQQSQQPYPKLPTFSLSRKDSSTTTTTAATTTIDSPISPTHPSSSLSTSVISVQSDTAVAPKILPPPLVKPHSMTENNNNNQRDKKFKKESETNGEGSRKKAKTIGKGTTTASKPNKAVGIQPLPPMCEDNNKKSSLPTVAATPIAGTSVNAAINSANSNGISQKTTTTATTAPSTGTIKNGSSHVVCTAKVVGNTIRKKSDAVTENTDKNTITSTGTGTGTKGQEIKSKYEEEVKDKTDKQIT